MALNGATPSQVTEIDIDLGRNRWLSLLKQSLNHPNTTKKEVVLKHQKLLCNFWGAQEQMFLT